MYHALLLDSLVAGQERKPEAERRCTDEGVKRVSQNRNLVRDHRLLESDIERLKRRVRNDVVAEASNRTPQRASVTLAARTRTVISHATPTGT